MILADQCVVCNGPISTQKTGMVAPFLAERIWGRKAFAITLARCSHCGFTFFNPRLGQEEENRLYEGYRDERYQQMRFQHEPWYTEKLNRDLSAETEMLDYRRRLLASAMTDYFAGQQVKTVLDFGGDQGQLIQELDVPGKYVFDISGTKSRDGVTALHSFEDCRSRSWDLIVCSHVLEHVAFPKTILSQIKELAHPGTLLYLEVPCESPFFVSTIAKRIAQILVLCATRTRKAGTMVSPRALYLMHEHINFFAAKSLAALAETMGFEVVKSGEYRTQAPLLLRGNCVWCVAKIQGK
jgi:2-polyprenyl-3-methyl-5-hydroxy-6-metoxy-1,4-benzoquinol methylase